MLSRRAFFGASAALVVRGQNPESKMFADAQAYDRFMGRWSRLVAPLLVDFAGLPETGRVLDIGSGTGSLAAAIARRKAGLRVTGIDPSKEYVAYAASTNRVGERLHFQVGDAQGMTFEDGTFDSSVSLLVFNFIPDRAKALREATRVTRPRGVISAAVWDYGDGMKMLRVFWDAAVATDAGAEKVDEKHMPLCRAGELSKLWQQGGLQNVSEQPLEISTKFDSFADYWEPFLLGQGPAGAYVRKLQGGRLEALRSAVKQRLQVSQENTSFTLPARVWAVKGTVPRRG